MRRPRSPSLFLTFALSFLAVLLVGIVLQGLVVVLVVQPVLGRWDATRASLIARQVAREIALHPETLATEEIRAILRRNDAEMDRLILIHEDPAGNLTAGRRLPPPLLRWLRSRLDGLEPPAELELVGPQEGPRTPGPPGPGRGPGWGRREELRRLQVICREEIAGPADQTGSVIALLPPRRWRDLPPATPGAILFFLPVAILVAGVAGLVVFRLLLRRLHALEMLATRLSQGDLQARVEDPGPDELGRLGARLNQMAANLAEARRLLDANDRQRRQLLADVSHELATPLTSIRGYTEMLQNPQLPLDAAERSTYLRNVLEETERMETLVQDILELSRLEAGAGLLDRERLDWTSLCRNTVERFQPRFSAAGLHLQWEEPETPCWIEADGRRMEQVVENLLGNALRYVPEGGRVTVTVTPEQASTCQLTVADDGPGFPEEDLPHVFDRFYRGDASRSSGGSGLGLAIVREIVQQHSGEVRAGNRRPRGAVLQVRLPRAR